MKLILTITGDSLGERERRFIPHGEYVEYSIGRDVDSDCYVGDKRVSKRHCVLIYDEGDVKAMDLRSANGTIVDGVPLGGDPKGSRKLMMRAEATVHVDPEEAAYSSVEEAIIHSGSIIEIGSTAIQVRIERDREPGLERNLANEAMGAKSRELLELFKLIDAKNPLYDRRESLIRSVKKLIQQLESESSQEVRPHG